MENPILLIATGVVVIVVLVVLILLFSFFSIWLRARVANAPVPLINMVAMRLRNVPFGTVVDTRITAVKAGLKIDTDLLEAHYLAGGNIQSVVLALIAANKAGISLDFTRACAIDLAPRRRSGRPVPRFHQSLPARKFVRIPSSSTYPKLTLMQGRYRIA